MSEVPLIEEVWPRADAKQSHLEVSFFLGTRYAWKFSTQLFRIRIPCYLIRLSAQGQASHI